MIPTEHVERLQTLRAQFEREGKELILISIESGQPIEEAIKWASEDKCLVKLYHEIMFLGGFDD